MHDCLSKKEERGYNYDSSEHPPWQPICLAGSETKKIRGQEISVLFASPKSPTQSLSPKGERKNEVFPAVFPTREAVFTASHITSSML